MKREKGNVVRGKYAVVKIFNILFSAIEKFSKYTYLFIAQH
jgi:hypothetical protein